MFPCGEMTRVRSVYGKGEEGGGCAGELWGNYVLDDVICGDSDCGGEIVGSGEWDRREGRDVQFVSALGQIWPLIERVTVPSYRNRPSPVPATPNQPRPPPRQQAALPPRLDPGNGGGETLRVAEKSR